MRKKIHKNLVGIAALAIILTIGLTFWAYFMMLQKQIFQDLQTDVANGKTHYYSVNSSKLDADSNYNNDVTKGENALAAGSYASAQKRIRCDRV